MKNLIISIATLVVMTSKGIASTPGQFNLGTFDQILDHSSPTSSPKFKQRYWISSEFARGEKAPVLFGMCNEGSGEAVISNTAYIMEHAKVLGAHVVYLEHRYYGESQPFSDISTEHLQYLTVDNAIEDLAEFQKWIMIQDGQLSGKWIAIGSSYGGLLSALYRFRHPELVVGALASSATIKPTPSPVEALPDTPVLNDYQNSLKSDDLTKVPYGFQPRQWAYQACTTFGFWESGDVNDWDKNTEVFYSNPRMCENIFGITLTPDFEKRLQEYFLPFITNKIAGPTNILFTNGEKDLWFPFSIPSEGDFSPVPGITVKIIKDGIHCSDLHRPKVTDSEDMVEARELFIELAHQWLAD